MKTSNYSLLLLILCLSSGLYASNDSLFRPRARIGVDISGFARHYFEPETMSWEAHADYEWRSNWYAAVEAGGVTVNMQKTTHHYTSGGYFFRTGIDYNFLSKPGMQEVGIVYGLVRYGFGRNDHEASDISIHNAYWDDLHTEVSSEKINAHWFEVGGGIKTRLAGQFYVGWSLRTRFLMHKTRTTGMEPYYISGFGKFENKPSVMLHYFISFRF